MPLFVAAADFCLLRSQDITTDNFASSGIVKIFYFEPRTNGWLN
jgi:hypothetical protein